jgi:rubredoxin
LLSRCFLQAEYGNGLRYWLQGHKTGCVLMTFYLKALLAVTQSTTWMCLICGWIYDESTGDPEHGVPPGTSWDAVPLNWTCPECGARKEDFEMVQI